jgi:uncharacterized hydrophobic protein (TIGR00271 family)
MFKKWFSFQALQEGADTPERVMEQVKQMMHFQGANRWILACAILIASIGLNVNSTAVIIGAMLISPLMGPIVSMGFALAMYDFALLRVAFKNLAGATLLSLCVSTIYFYVSPFKEVQSELLARTSPNLYDVLIAFIGGLVGAIALTRAEKGNPIPGVAIATALMPPLCTAGFGLATQQYAFFGGALYLFGINCVFIALATLLVVRWMEYPAIRINKMKMQAVVRWGVSLLVLIFILPGFYFVMKLYEEKKFIRLANEFVSKEFSDEGLIVLKKKITWNKQGGCIDLLLWQDTLSSEFVQSKKMKCANYALGKAELVLRYKENLWMTMLQDEMAKGDSGWLMPMLKERMTSTDSLVRVDELE